MRKWIPGILIVAVLFAGGLLFTSGSLAQVNVSNFSNLRTDGFMRADTYIRADSYITSGTYVDVGSYLNVGTLLRLEPATSITVTTDGTITPTGSYQKITSSGNVQTSAIAAGTAGDILLLENNTNTTITLTDTGTLKLGGNRALGQYDTLLLFSDGTNWIEASFTNN